MATVEFNITDTSDGAFIIRKQGKNWGDGRRIFGDCLTVCHTHVIPEAEGKGYARQLLDAMVAYVRENKLWAIPLCPCVRAQFKHNPDAYADIWER